MFWLSICSEIAAQMSYYALYYSAKGAYASVSYVLAKTMERSKRKETQRQKNKIRYCPYDEETSLNEEDSFVLILTDSTALLDMQRFIHTDYMKKKIK